MYCAMDQFLSREATLEDKQDILDIRDNIYDGQDYLRAYFDHFMTDPSITPYVAVRADTIVGFVIAHVVDEGTTVVTRAARTNPAFSGQGIYSSLTRHILMTTNAKTVAFVSSNRNPAVNKTSFKNIHRQILSRKRFCFRVNLNAIVFPAQSLSESCLTTPSTDDITYTMSSTAHKEYLFPKDRIVVDGVHYKLLPSNIQFFSHTGVVTRIVSNALKDIGAHKGLLSISTFYKCQKPKFCSLLDIYGTDFKCLKDHLLFHFRHFREITDSETMVRIYLEKSIDDDYALQVINDIGVAKGRIVSDCLGQQTSLIFERDV